MSQLFKIFCDESCHLPHDGSDIMVFGALYCPAEEVERFNRQIKALRQAHNYQTEIKWTKLIKRQWPFYQSLIDFLLDEQCLQFKATVVQNKRSLDHDKFNEGSHSNFYYKMAYYSLRDFMSAGNKYRVYLDYMDTLGAEKCRTLAEVLRNGLKNTSEIEVFTVRSFESQLIQLCDLIIGAVSYANRSNIAKQSAIKNQIIQHLEQKLHRRLDMGTPPWEAKFNLFKFSPRSVGC
jgi:hypothetical protein